MAYEHVGFHLSVHLSLLMSHYCFSRKCHFKAKTEVMIWPMEHLLNIPCDFARGKQISEVEVIGN